MGDDTLGGDDGTDSIDGGAGNDSIIGGEGDDTINVAAGNDVVKFISVLDGHDLITGFDGNAAGGGQDKIDLIALFDSLPGPVPPDQRASRVAILDHGSTVDIRINADGDLSNGYELTIATLQTKDAVTIGEDVILS